MTRAATTTDVFNAIADPRRREVIRVLADGRLTQVRFVHRAMGWIVDADRGVDVGWTDLMMRIRSAVEKRDSTR